MVGLVLIAVFWLMRLAALVLALMTGVALARGHARRTALLGTLATFLVLGYGVYRAHMALTDWYCATDRHPDACRSLLGRD